MRIYLHRYSTLGNFQSQAFSTLEKAKAYMDSHADKPAWADGSGRIVDYLSIFETEYEPSR